MSMKLDGTQSPAEAIREEINKLKKEAGIEEVVEETDETVEESDDNDDPSLDAFDDNTAIIDEPEPTPKEQTVDYWKHRFEVMQGKYNKEVPLLNDRVNYLAEQVENLKNKPTTPDFSDGASVGEILDDLEDQYGSEFTTAIDKRISRIVKEQVRDIVSNFENDLTSVKKTQAVSEQAMFEEVVDKLSPNWKSLNVNPEFVSWVQNSVESFSGVTFQEILIDAYQRRDATKIAKIFNTYEQLKTKTPTRQQGTKQEASSLITPPKRGSTANTVIDNNSGKVFTQAQVSEFYNNLAQGVYKGKDVWVRSMKEEILKANAEGRIV